MRILVAEDDPVSRRVLEIVLTKLGHECEAVADGDAAWTRLQRGAPDVLITDWMMPGLAGPDVIRRLRAAHGGDCYVIMLTALSGHGDIKTAMEAGADDFLTKPLDRTHLMMRLNVAGRLSALRARVNELEAR